MILSKKILIMFIVIIIIPFLVGCGMSDSPVSPPTHTLIPSTHTSIPPTPTLQPFVVTLDGNECILSGPTEVPPGEYPIFLNNLMEIDRIILLARYPVDDRTFQDLLNLQNEPGEDFAMPDWTILAEYRFSAVDNAYIYTLDNSGEYFIYIWRGWEPDALWLCTPPLKVIEASSE